MRQAFGDRDQRGKGLGVGAVAAVVGQFAGGVAAADQQPVVTGLVGVFGQVDPGPGVPALAFAAGAGGADLPRPRRYRSGEDLDAGGSGVDRDAPVRGDLHHVSQSQRAEGAPQLGVGAVHLIAGDPPRRGTPRTARVIILASQRPGLVANVTSGGIFAPARRCGSPAHPAGRYNARSMNGRCAGRRTSDTPRLPAPRSDPPAVPVYAPCPPRPSRCPSSGPRSHRPPAPRSGHPSCPRHSRADRPGPPPASPFARDSRCCNASGLE